MKQIVVVGLAISWLAACSGGGGTDAGVVSSPVQVASNQAASTAPATAPTPTDENAASDAGRALTLPSSGVMPGEGATRLALGNNHTCALRDGSISCWGSDLYGQVEPPPTILDASDIAAGDQNTCAVDAFNLTCWGIDGLDVYPVSHPIAVATLGFHVCVIDADGLRCLRGTDDDGQLDVPADLVNPTQVATGLAHTCALDDNGVHCWGSNDYGESSVPSLEEPRAIAAGGNFSCAIDAAGVTCWGNNQFGQLDVPSMVDPVSIAAGFANACAVDRYGVRCWGNDDYGQSDVPALVEPVSVVAGAHHTCAVE
ncbi:MAG: hypothetical protein KDI19_11535, partial [Pseudomonadales bacterium]|nr:hypothetical protein [Pseudomonadales bacterium]